MATPSRKTTYYLHDKIDEIHGHGINIDTREIFLHGLLDEENYYVDHIMLNNFIKNIRFLSDISQENIVIHQYNLGGECDAGFGIYDMIKNCRCHITIICHGHCASMGTIITQAADVRLCMPNCYFMLHEGGASTEGTFKHTQAMMQYHIDVTSRMYNVYINSMKHSPLFEGWTENKIKKFLQDKFDKKEDWYLPPKEAMELGLIDDIVGVTKYKNLCELFNV